MIQKIVDGVFELSCKSDSPEGGRSQGNRALSVSLKISMDTRFSGAHPKPCTQQQQEQAVGMEVMMWGWVGNCRCRECLWVGLRVGLRV